jgi:group I intron endonuclease
MNPTTGTLFDTNLRRVSGIYLIEHVASKKVYVGSTNNLYLRRRGHFSTLRRKCHKNEYLQNAYNKYGQRSFRFTVIEECAIDVLIEREQFWIDRLRATNKKYGYNISPQAGGHAQSPETRAKIAKASTGKVRTKEHCRNLSKALSGKRPWATGIKRSSETRKKMSESMKGNQNFKGKTHNEIWLKKMRGRKFSDEHKRKIGEANKGKKPTAETKEKMRLSALARRERERLERELSEGSI